jgi:hypothetical protein
MTVPTQLTYAGNIMGWGTLGFLYGVNPDALTSSSVITLGVLIGSFTLCMMIVDLVLMIRKAQRSKT